MLSAFPPIPELGESLTNASWIDLIDPTSTEIAAFEKAFGLRVPTTEELSEIETTSRLQVDHGALYMTVPLILAAGIPPHFGCRNLRDELQEYARTELGMGLSFCFVFDCFDDAPATNLVQVEGLDLTIGISDGSHPPPP